MAATAILYVVIPRLLLALLATARLGRAAASVALPESLSTYARAVLGASDAALPAQVARLTAFAYEPAAASERGLQRLLRAAFGADTRIEFAPQLQYGDESAYATRGVGVDIEILLFNLAATPEAENHGAVLRLLNSHGTAVQGARVLVLVDESPYLARLGGDTSLAGRIEQRRAAWSDFVRSHGLEACLVNLAAAEQDGPVDPAVIERMQRSCRSGSA